MSPSEKLFSLQNQLVDLQRKRDNMFEHRIYHCLEITDLKEQKEEQQEIERELGLQIAAVGQQMERLRETLVESEEGESNNSEDGEEVSSDEESDSDEEDYSGSSTNESEEQVEDYKTEIEHLRPYLEGLRWEVKKAGERYQELEKENKYLADELEARTTKLFKYIARYPQFVDQKTVEELHVEVSDGKIQIDHLEAVVSDLKKLLYNLMNELIYLGSQVNKQKETLAQENEIEKQLTEEEIANLFGKRFLEAPDAQTEVVGEKHDVEKEILLETNGTGKEALKVSEESGHNFSALLDAVARYQTAQEVPVDLESEEGNGSHPRMRSGSIQEIQAEKKEDHVDPLQDLLPEDWVLEEFEFGFKAILAESAQEELQRNEGPDTVQKRDDEKDEDLELEDDFDEWLDDAIINGNDQDKEPQEKDLEEPILLENRSGNGREAAEFFIIIALFVLAFSVVHKLLDMF